jgi:uncharacterized protein YbcC (UPF0753/DUF2309 family)
MNNHQFDEHALLHKLKHYLPSQNPLKDFVHHNTLHAFQNLPFHEGTKMASTIFGYKVYLRLAEYREHYNKNKINDAILEKIIIEKKGKENLTIWKNNVLKKNYDTFTYPRIGKLREYWRKIHKVNLDKEVHVPLFHSIGSYLDQGIAVKPFPVHEGGFLDSLRILEKNTYVSMFKRKKAAHLLLNTDCHWVDLLKILVADEDYYEQYIFDQQFAHPGWSGMVSVLESNPESLLHPRNITLKDFISFELLLEIDALEAKLGKNFTPLAQHIDKSTVKSIFSPIPYQELFEVYAIWQEAFEWSYYDEVLKGLQISYQIEKEIKQNTSHQNISFQGLFCIDDRECSLRRYIEKLDKNSRTFGTPGFFNIDAFFQPEHSIYYTKICPAPLTPTHLIKEKNSHIKQKKELYFNHNLEGVLGGWIGSQTLGIWSAIKLAFNIFKPSEIGLMVSSCHHMDKTSELSIHFEEKTAEDKHNLQIGFTIEEMADRIESLLKSIGLVENFASIVYIIGHGASSVNNTHYAGYDCGACSGRAGSVNARTAAAMANCEEVREILAQRNIIIPTKTQFIGGLHDTTRDEITFYDENLLSEENQIHHQKNKKIFEKALDYNAKERARRFVHTNIKRKSKSIHEKVKLRSISLFEPRPEWNHATNAICIVGKRENNRHVFLDRRAFLQSYNYQNDLDGKYLANILKAAIPVCGGINLEYYFSRTDNDRLGAGTKLSHNVMGLLGVANGMNGDLRTGLPKQMINIHDPIRLMLIVEHYPEVVLNVLKSIPSAYEWVKNHWLNLSIIHPETHQLYYFNNESLVEYMPITSHIRKIDNLNKIIETHHHNLPIYIIE